MSQDQVSQDQVTGRRRGPYSNGQQRREEFIRQAYELFAEQGFQRLSLRKIAEALGVSHAALSYHFATQEDLLRAVFDLQAERDRPFLSQGLAERGLLDLAPEAMRHAIEAPGLIQLDTTIQAEAVRADHPAHDYVAQRLEDFNQVIRGELELERERGRLRDDLDLDVVAHQFTALTRGLYLAWLYDRTLAMDDHIGAFVALLRRDGGAPSGPVTRD